MDFTLEKTAIDHLDLSGVQPLITELAQDPLRNARQLTFKIDFPREESDPREFSEIEEIRLWFIRLDAAYPWLPYLLNWRSGELTRYCAMLVPHRFDRRDGIIFNDDALMIFVLSKVFTVQKWLSEHNIQNNADLRYMAQTLGYDLDPAFFSLL